MSLTFYIIMLIVSIIGVILGIANLFLGDSDGLVILFLCGLMCFLWTHKITNHDEEVKARSEATRIVSIETERAPQIDTIVTNRTDTLYVYRFLNPNKVQR